MGRILAIFTLLVSIGFVGTVCAQDVISPEKKKIISEIITVTEADVKAKETLEKMLTAISSLYPLTVKDALEKETKLNASDRKLIEDQLVKSKQNFDKRFRKRLFERVDFEAAFREMSYGMYAKFFSEKELRELLIFYKTPTGKKLVKVGPEMAMEAIRQSTKVLLPQVMEIVDELVKEDIERSRPKRTGRKEIT